MNGVIEGRIVHFVLPNGEHCAAMIVKAWSEELVNLQLFPDSNPDGTMNQQVHPRDRWVTSVKYAEDNAPRTWHWIERV